jgi:hypothetical protein
VAIFVVRCGGAWRLMPMRVLANREGVTRGRKGSAGVNCTEVIFESLEGCPWEGELRVSLEWSGKGEGS